MAPEDVDTWIDAGEVAAILGLAHRNSVSTYRSRYPDFPAARPAPGGGRTRLWDREEILTWHRAFQARKSAGNAQAHARLEDLVAAATRLLVANPGQEISIRQIAAEAGFAHSDLYRYATSKDQLIDLAIGRVEQSLRTILPQDYDLLVDNLPAILQATKASAGGVRVLTDRVIQGKHSPVSTPLPVNTLAEVIAGHHHPDDPASTVDPRVLAACITSTIWGLTVLEPRWLQALDLPEIPPDQVAAIIRAMLTAGQPQRDSTPAGPAHPPAPP